VRRRHDDTVDAGRERIELVAGEPGAGLCRHHEDTRAVGGAQLDHVPCECFQRIETDLDDRAPACRQAAQGRFTMIRVHRLGTDHRESLADREQHVGVVDGRAVAATRGEYACLESELARELLQHRRMSSRRQAGVGDACDVIEHHAAGALEESLAKLVMRESSRRVTEYAPRSTRSCSRSGLRSWRRVGASMGYSTTVPSSWKLTQLFGNTASGQRGSGRSSTTWIETPAARSAATRQSNSSRAADASPGSSGAIRA
jgi:hypothetical protein